MNTEYLPIFKKHQLNFARLLSGSKSFYRNLHPKDEIIFNARIYTIETYEKYKNTDIIDFFKGQDLEIWYGDLNLTIDEELLKAVSKEIGPIAITTEDGTLRKIIND